MNVKLRNNSIDIFRYLAAVNVVMFHCHGFSEIGQTLNYVLAQILTRVAVPFFFTVGGYYFSQIVHSENNSKKLISVKHVRSQKQ